MLNTLRIRVRNRKSDQTHRPRHQTNTYVYAHRETGHVCVRSLCIYVRTRSVPVTCARLMVVVERGARGRWWGRQVITGKGGIVTRTERRERMLGGFRFVRVACLCEHERKNREEK